MSTSIPKILSASSASAFGKPATVLCCCVHAISAGNVEAGRIVTPPFQSVTATIFAPFCAQQVGGHRPTLPKPWTATVAPLMLEAEMLGGLARRDHHAAAGRFAAAERSAHDDRLAGDDGGFGVADVHAVGVHDPRHDLFVGVDVGRRHVLVGADGVDDFRDVAPRERFQFARRHLRRVADDAALAAAERECPATAHFHVIHAASAFTSSSETSG